VKKGPERGPKNQFATHFSPATRSRQSRAEVCPDSRRKRSARPATPPKPPATRTDAPRHNLRKPRRRNKPPSSPSPPPVTKALREGRRLFFRRRGFLEKIDYVRARDRQTFAVTPNSIFDYFYWNLAGRGSFSRRFFEKLFFAINERIDVVGSQFESVAVRDRVRRARFHAITAENAPRIIYVVHAGVALTR
jgi:hypothetical protein